MKRYASHRLCIAGKGFLPHRYVVETEEGRVSRLFPLEGEPEDTEWLPGALLLLPENQIASLPECLEQSARFFPEIRLILSGNQADYKINQADSPDEPAYSLCGLVAVHLPGFNLVSMKPAAGTRHRLLP